MRQTLLVATSDCTETIAWAGKCVRDEQRVVVQRETVYRVALALVDVVFHACHRSPLATLVHGECGFGYP